MICRHCKTDQVLTVEVIETRFGEHRVVDCLNETCPVLTFIHPPLINAETLDEVDK